MAPKNKGKGKEAATSSDSKDADTKGKGKGGASASGKLKPATSINVRHILCEKHSKKEEALQKLRDGAKFDDVARELSEDKARQGGSLGWKTRGSLLPEFEKIAYELEPSTTGNPKWGEVKTREGYHVLMVEGRK
ncbi:peptidyl-prolyl cis-trans isomerase pin4 [Lindgomyces ingoldianus]|uniref:Peptidyl-prolyl cis-trans isomerase pin4 n=1 Tax=Lindgomyces ingoldianus TaxID=673940 RepID=A0ACB6RCR1_9PLEO|nr:peptidyl-prolyl cis-trans isomerase pin4 [Lindgomyces ingoldianus]KAF2476882.1 peptidyl-prolyl cis-trans isomerase pin4 [Lindgomyces ingoldianus]